MKNENFFLPVKVNYGYLSINSRNYKTKAVTILSYL